MENRTRFSIFYYLIVFMAIFSIDSMLFGGSGVKKVPYSEFLDRVRADRVEEVVLTEDTLYGLLKSPESEAAKGQPDVDPPGDHTPWRLNWHSVKSFFVDTRSHFRTTRRSSPTKKPCISRSPPWMTPT